MKRMWMGASPVMLARTFGLVFSLVAMLCFAAPTVQASEVEAKQFAEELGNKAIAVAANKGLSAAQKLDKLEDLFAQSVDIEGVAKFVLGRYWRDASDAQKKQYLKNYRDFLIKHYTANLLEYTNESFKITRATPGDEENEYQLTMEIVRPGKESVIVEYSVRGTGKNFKVFDINVEGVSLVTTQRSEFASVVSRNGLDYLIEQLAKRTQELVEKKTTQKS